MNATHGLASTYRNSHYKCRCNKCRKAHARRHFDEKQRRVKKLAINSKLAPHGQESTYINWGCRCEPCRKAHSKRWYMWYANRSKSK